MEKLIARSDNVIARVESGVVRSLMNRIDWNARLIAIRGARGVGKTTMLLQYLRKQGLHAPEAAYVLLDDLYFTEHTLVEFAEQFMARGGRYLFLDEVHKYARGSWSQEIKNLYDYYPQLKIVFTGSSILDIIHARGDLSRRALIYDLAGLSYREYLQLSGIFSTEAISVTDLFSRHEEIAYHLVRERDLQPLVHWERYLRRGYYPFFLEGEQTFDSRLTEVVKLVLEVDLDYAENLRIAGSAKLQRLLFAIATSAPFIPNIAKLSERLEISRNTLLQYIYLLERAKLLNLLLAPNRGISSLQKPNKIYLENPALAYVLGAGQVQMGAIRETFFLNQLAIALGNSLTPQGIYYPKQGDFSIELGEDWYNVEIGGGKKSLRQLEGMDNAFVVADDIETGYGRKIPLWLFGFLY